MMGFSLLCVKGISCSGNEPVEVELTAMTFDLWRQGHGLILDSNIYIVLKFKLLSFSHRGRQSQLVI